MTLFNFLSDWKAFFIILFNPIGSKRFWKSWIIKMSVFLKVCTFSNRQGSAKLNYMIKSLYQSLDNVLDQWQTSQSQNLAQQCHRTKIQHFFTRHQKIPFSDFGLHLKMLLKIMAVFGRFLDLTKNSKMSQMNITLTSHTCFGHQMAVQSFVMEEKMNISSRKISIGSRIRLERAI